MTVLQSLLAAAVLVVGLVRASESWKPAPAPPMTRWAADVTPQSVWPEYPRPLLVRGHWQNLNGLWDYAVVRISDLPVHTPPEGKKAAEWFPRISVEEALPFVRKTERPEKWMGQALVPFPVGSALSGVEHLPEADEAIWYRHPLKLERRLPDHRVLLNFEGVDWHCTVWANGKQVAEHSGGSEPFSADITDALGPDDSAEIIVRAWDPTNLGPQPRGKQVLDPEGYWYTRVSGIWQTVWLEQVPAEHVTAISAVATPELHGLDVTVQVSGDKPQPVKIALKDGDKIIQAAGSSGIPIRVAIPHARLWSPDNPALYNFTVTVPSETVSSYAAIRRFERKSDEKGIPRICLNGKPIFLCGALDQGWWPDGLYLAPTDAALRYDIEAAKQLGFNMVRKHIKVEPRRWYRHCDELGIVVLQDLPSGSTGMTAEGRRIHWDESLGIVDHLRGYPCIGMWVVFNEGWGQDDDRNETRTAELTKAIKESDPTRLVSCASGWHDRKVGDVRDIHAYPGPAMPKVEKERAIVLGEFGGLALPVEGHLWNSKGWGYAKMSSAETLMRKYDRMNKLLQIFAGEGLCASVYTQITDVESEVNGLMTYDRAVMKLPVAQVERANRSLVDGTSIPKFQATVDTSEDGRAVWRYTTTKPGEGWEKEIFDQGRWDEGEAGFGANLPPDQQKRVRTAWTTPEIWLRKEFETDDAEVIRICNDGDTEIFVNGELVAKLGGHNIDYRLVVPEKDLQLKKGRNVMAVHCSNGGDAKFIDVGLVRLIP